MRQASTLFRGKQALRFLTLPDRPLYDHVLEAVLGHATVLVCLIGLTDLLNYFMCDRVEEAGSSWVPSTRSVLQESKFVFHLESPFLFDGKIQLGL